MAKLLIWLFIVIANVLLVNGLNESFANWTTNMQGSGLVSNLLVTLYNILINTITLTSEVLDLPINIFSQAFKDVYWCFEPYPCLQVGGPFISVNHPVSLPPYPPSILDVKMELYTRRNPNNPFVFNNPNDVSMLNQSPFQSNAPTKFLMGGFFGGNGNQLIPSLVPDLLANNDYNVINVNWNFASSTTYCQATANIRLVGLVLGRFIELLHNVTGLPLSQCHIIAHSISCHGAGYAGQYLKGQLGRISGMDPAGPYFVNTDPVVRLDPTDALFVDVIHTNKGSLETGHVGIDQAVGHVDFYPNGGAHQPNCSTFFFFDVGALAESVSVLNSGCSHVRVISYYAESIPTPNSTDCRFTSYPCSSYANFQCNSCLNSSSTVEMGFDSYKYADNYSYPIPQSPYGFYIDTNGASPYFKNNAMPDLGSCSSVAPLPFPLSLLST